MPRRPRLASAHGSKAAEGRAWGVAHLFGKQGPGACVDCHVEHKGRRRQSARARRSAPTAAGLKGRLPDTKLGDASDFGKNHPGTAALAGLRCG